MYNRIRVCLCHPGRIALFFKDKVSMVVLYILLLFAVFVGVAALQSFSSDHFDYEDTKSITNLVVSENKGDAIYDASTHTLTGTAMKYEASDFILDVLTEEVYGNSTKLVFKLKTNEVQVVRSGYIIGTYTYQELGNASFDFGKILNGDIVSTMNFQSMMNTVLDRINPSYALSTFLESLGVGIGYFVLVVILALVSSYFVNPGIDGKIRMKLCVYSCGVCFLAMTFSMLFQAYWLQYVALILPLIYANITFTHIVKVPKPKV